MKIYLLYQILYESLDMILTDGTNLMINSFHLKELDNVVDDGEDDDRKYITQSSVHVQLNRY